MELIKDPENLIGAKTAVCQGRIFLFGGQIQHENQQPIPNSTLYELKISSNDNKYCLEFHEVKLTKNIKPCARTSHSMIGINSQNFMMIGGISLEGALKGQILRDMWLFNTEESAWMRVNPANGILRGFCDSSLCLHNNKLHIIGGLAETLETWNEQISIVEFGQD